VVLFSGRKSLKHYPVMLDISEKPVIVVGGGKVASRKVMRLLECGARVTVISPMLEPELEHLADERRIDWIAEPFDESLLDRIDDPVLIFGTTDRQDVNVRIHAGAVKRAIPCNIADVPDLCTFTVPAVVARGDLTIAVSTGGSSPALARRIREELEKNYGCEYAAMTKVLGDLRTLILRDRGSSEENRQLFFRIVDSGVLQALRENDRTRAAEILKSILPERIDAESILDEAFKASTEKG
jgi:precorrin-2 dehydrogenase/sirohydrochlorin ferrochelatase